MIVGGGLAGAKAAQTLRDEGFDGDVLLIGKETDRPYERPPLSKGYLLGNDGLDKVYVHPETWYTENNVELRLETEVASIDRSTQHVSIEGGDSVHYDSLLLATGSTPRRLPVQGADLEGVLYLRTLDDSDRIKAAFAGAQRVVIVGGGWIGLETAAAARASGLHVTVLERDKLPLLRVLGSTVAQVFAGLHRDHDVDLRCNVEVSGLIDDGRAVTGVRLGDGTQLEADLVLVGVGITPNTALAVDAELKVGNGITVDAHLRTSDQAIYAAGDVADAFHPSLQRHIRVEHWANALRQGPIAAKCMLGQSVTYDRLPYFFSDQYDLGMEYTGYVEPEAYDHIVIRGDLPGRQFIAFWLADRRVQAGMNVNTWDVTADIEQLIRSGRPVDTNRLADSQIPLAAL